MDVEQRPLSAPGNNLPQDDSDHERPKRVVSKPPLLRSKSERIVRHEDTDQIEEEINGWGARHGFEDHYQSDEIISNLASVSIMLPRLTVLISSSKYVLDFVILSIRIYLPEDGIMPNTNMYI